jgi:hypothetical protein
MNITRKQLEAKAKELGAKLDIQLHARRGMYDVLDNCLSMDFPDGKVYDQLHYIDLYWQPRLESTASIYEWAYRHLQGLEDCPLADCEVCNENKKSWSVWVGGSEVNDHYLTLPEALTLAYDYRQGGYTDVLVELERQEKG